MIAATVLYAIPPELGDWQLACS